MTDDRRQKTLEDAVLVQLLYLNAKVQGVVTGVVAALAIFIATNWLVLKGGEVIGPHLGLLGQFFIGYRVSFVGSLIGAAYGFVVGYVIGYSAAKLYNAIARFRDGSEDGAPEAEPPATPGAGGEVDRER
jgi:hypothetical protein